MRELFANDPERAARFTLEDDGMVLDYAKHRVTHESMRLLFALARDRQLVAARAAMFAGDEINTTEHRPALHIALRQPAGAVMQVGGRDVMPAVHAVLDRMEAFCGQVHSGAWRGFGGEPIRDVVNLGIGGSDLGPRMAVRALRPFAKPQLRVHFVSNVDGAHLHDTLQSCSPATTLFVIASKTFTTQETMANAHSARAWLLAGGAEEGDIARHFVAVSVNTAAATAFGIAAAYVFEFWPWVGGRFSLWSSIGLPVALALGMPNFRALLAGAHQMDQHFKSQPIERNMPVVLALLGVWCTNFFGAQTHAVLPYDQSLECLPAYLQQLEMESNGKSVSHDGAPTRCHTAPILWGAPGTDGQHAFFQLLHQGTAFIPSDFIGFSRPQHPLPGHHALLMANMFAQSAALMHGKTLEEASAELAAAGASASAAPVEALARHKVFGGSRPSTTLLMPALEPHALGRLLALYEHKVFCQGVIWNVNSFDQWGVELGKQLAGRVGAAMQAPAPAGRQSGLDGSTLALVQRWREQSALS